MPYFCISLTKESLSVCPTKVPGNEKKNTLQNICVMEGSKPQINVCMNLTNYYIIIINYYKYMKKNPERNFTLI